MKETTKKEMIETIERAFKVANTKSKKSRLDLLKKDTLNHLYKSALKLIKLNSIKVRK